MDNKTNKYGCSPLIKNRTATEGKLVLSKFLSNVIERCKRMWKRDAMGTVGFHWRETLERDAALKRRETQPKTVKADFFFVFLFLIFYCLPKCTKCGNTKTQKVIFLEKTIFEKLHCRTKIKKKFIFCYISIYVDIF